MTGLGRHVGAAPIGLGLISIACFLALALPAGAGELVPLHAHPPGLAWPTGSWPSGKLPSGLDTAAFERSIDELFAPRGRGGFADTRALLVVRHGRIVYERYAEGFGPESRFQSWSMAKSVTNALVARLVARGRLLRAEPAPVEAWQSGDDPRREITLEQLLQMRSGLGNGDGFGSGDIINAFVSQLLFGEGSTAPGAYAANVPLEHPIGRHWEYSTGGSIILARICADAIGGGPEGMRDFLRDELFLPIGMRSAQPEFAKSGEFIGGAFVHATARDWARFGYLYLRDGVWDGQRLLPEGWVDFSRTASPAENNSVHGAHFWVNHTPHGEQWPLLPGAPESTFAADGAYFQMVAIVPTKDLVAVRLGETQSTPYPAVKEIFGRTVASFPGADEP